MSETASPDGIHVVIEMADSYVPTPRLAAAVAELRDALIEAHGDDDEVSGFMMPGADLVGQAPAGFIQRLESSWRPNQTLSVHQALCDNEVIEGVFKF